MIIAGMSLVQLLVLIIVVGGAIAITYIILQQMGIAIPDWLVRIFWVIVAVVIGIFAIQFVMSLVR
ncbi:unnamed protein product [uncultured bacterium]|nr:unnamed protein product [uncultured bacterium]